MKYTYIKTDGQKPNPQCVNREMDLRDGQMPNPQSVNRCDKLCSHVYAEIIINIVININNIRNRFILTNSLQQEW